MHARTRTWMRAHICTCTHTHALINHRCRRMCSVTLCQAGDHAMPWARSRQKPLETAAVGYFRLPLGKHTARETRAIQQHSQAVLKCLWDHPNWPDPSTSFLWGSVSSFFKRRYCLKTTPPVFFFVKFRGGMLAPHECGSLRIGC